MTQVKDQKHGVKNKVKGMMGQSKSERIQLSQKFEAGRDYEKGHLELRRPILGCKSRMSFFETCNQE